MTEHPERIGFEGGQISQTMGDASKRMVEKVAEGRVLENATGIDINAAYKHAGKLIDKSTEPAKSSFDVIPSDVRDLIQNKGQLRMDIAKLNEEKRILIELMKDKENLTKQETEVLAKEMTAQMGKVHDLSSEPKKKDRVDSVLRQDEGYQNRLKKVNEIDNTIAAKSDTYSSLSDLFRAWYATTLIMVGER
jgi:hypothetical protein